MKKVFLGIVLVTLVIFGATFIVQAASLEEAKALGEKAAAWVKVNGKEKGIAELGNPKGQFVKGEMYVTFHDFNGIFLANPANKMVEGQNHFDLKDPNGKLFVQEMIEIAKTKGSGWITYMWTNPATKKVQAKKSWVKRVEGTDLFTLSGIFQ